jgi:hypothetical protein
MIHLLINALIASSRKMARELQQTLTKTTPYNTKQNLDIQVKDKPQGKKCWLREVFRLIVAAIDKIRKPIHEL